MVFAVESASDWYSLHPWEHAGRFDGYSRAVVGIERMHQMSGEWVLPRGYFEGFMPGDELWENPNHIFEKENPHNKAHNPRVVIAAYHIALYEFRDRPEDLPKILPIILETLKWHDIRQGRDENNPYHGIQASALFRQDSQTALKYSPQEIEDIAYLIAHHSDRNYPPEDAQLTRLKELFDIIRDADACELTRAPLHFPLYGKNRIELHTEAAKLFNLPDVMRLLQLEADRFEDCDIVEAQWKAAQILGLIPYES